MRAPQRPPQIDGPDGFARAFAVSRETVEKLELFAALLRQWQSAVNLVAPRTLDDVWHRHFADSAQLARLVPQTARSLIDLGTGAGFPGLVLAVVLAPDRAVRITLIESDQRKAAFLREVARQVAIPVDILSTRIESTETHSRVAAADVVTARALAPLRRLLDWATPLLAAGGLCLFPKGRDVEREIADARGRWRFEVDLVPSLTDAAGRIIVLRRLALNEEVEP